MSRSFKDYSDDYVALLYAHLSDDERNDVMDKSAQKRALKELVRQEQFLSDLAQKRDAAMLKLAEKTGLEIDDLKLALNG